MDESLTIFDNAGVGRIDDIDADALKSGYKALERSANLLSQSFKARGSSKEKHLLGRVAADRIKESNELLSLINQLAIEVESPVTTVMRNEIENHTLNFSDDIDYLLSVLLRNENRNAETLKEAVFDARSTHIKSVLLEHYTNLSATSELIALKLRPVSHNTGGSKAYAQL